MNPEFDQNERRVRPPGLQPPDSQPCRPGALTRRSRYKICGLSTILLLAMFSVPLYHVVRGTPKGDEIAADAPSVAVAKVKREDLAQELVCDGELKPYLEIDLHAKVAGYLENISVDIGDRVETGQFIAKIEIPELGDDIKREVAMQERSQQEVARTEAAYEEAHAVFTRLMAVNKAQPKLIAQQELDEAQAKDRTTASALAVTRAEVDVAGAEMAKLQTMLKYTQITAPFAGVITKRYADPGTLIQAGTSSSTQTLPLVRLSQNDRLRLDIPISVSYVSRINVGDPVEIRVEALEKTIQGTIARSTRKVETATRTMDVEVDVPNPDLRLIPGMYASVVLRLDHREKTLAVPVEAVSRQKTSTVFVINPANKIEERVVSLGLETARELEVLSGLKENELVMIGSRTQVKAGQLVEPKLIEEIRVTQ